MDIASAVMMVVMLLFYLAMLVFSLVIYILGGIGQMKMARSCGLKRGWMAFVPFANAYLLGQMAEQNPSSDKKSWPWRHIMLVGQIVIVALSLALGIAMGLQAVDIADVGGELSPFDLLEIYGGTLGLMLPLSLLSAIYSVVTYIIYWKIFALFAPNTAIVYLVLSILFGGTATSICFFILRNRTPQNRPGSDDSAWT